MRLLTKTIRNYSFFAIFVVVAGTPAFYFILRALFNGEQDEYLMVRKKELLEKRNYLKTDSDILLYQALDSDIELTHHTTPIATERFYTFHAYDSTVKDIIPFRALETGIEINGNYYKLIVKESLVTNEDLIEAIMMVQGLLLMLILAGSVIMNRIMTSKTWNPFYKTLAQLKLYQIDQNPALALDRSDINEFNDLNKVITELVEKNYRIYLSQKEFTENAAHEIQTPLAIFQSKLELMMQKASMTEDEASLINSLYEAITRLSRLNKNLLLLAKIENDQFKELDQVNIPETLKKTLSYYQDQLEQKRIQLQVVGTENYFISADMTLMEILLQNLISNAIRHTPVQGDILIRTEDNQLVISNSGQPLPHPDKIFDRFYRESKDEKGTGLGLSIVKKIVEVSGFTINYSYRTNHHHFEITFTRPF